MRTYDVAYVHLPTATTALPSAALAVSASTPLELRGTVLEAAAGGTQPFGVPSQDAVLPRPATPDKSWALYDARPGIDQLARPADEHAWAGILLPTEDCTEDHPPRPQQGRSRRD